MEIQTLRGVGYDCNSYLIKDRIWVLVDVGTDQNAKRIADKISGMDEIDRVKKIVLTHTHFDHAGGAASLGEMTGAEILVHPLEGRRISSGDFSVTLSDMFGRKMRGFEWTPIDEGDTIETGTRSFITMHVPGHSEGSIGLFEEKSGSLIIGDTVFANGGIGRYDLPSSDGSKLRASIERLAKLKVENIYPGHGSEVIGEGSDHIRMSSEVLRRGI